LRLALATIPRIPLKFSFVQVERGKCKDLGDALTRAAEETASLQAEVISWTGAGASPMAADGDAARVSSGGKAAVGRHEDADATGDAVEKEMLEKPAAAAGFGVVTKASESAPATLPKQT